MVYVLFAAGLVLLIVGAEALVRGASRLAASVGITPLVIGLTVVAFGTSSPELSVSIMAAVKGQEGANIALGNVVGSNIFNVLLILGLSALAAPLIVAQKLVRLDVPIMIGLSFGLLALGWDGTIDRNEGALLVMLMVGYTWFAIRQGRAESPQIKAEYAEAFGEGPPKHALTWDLLWIAAGLAMLVLGSRWLVSGAVSMAQKFGVSDLVISLTIVAAGTSLPEVATSVMASVRGERDIAVGNVVGSNIFNILSVLGLSSLVSPGGVEVAPAALGFDIPVMIAVALICLPIFFTGYRIVRLEGLLLLVYYLMYVGYVILAAQEHDALPMFSGIVRYLIIPLTALALAVGVFAQLRQRAMRPKA